MSPLESPLAAPAAHAAPASSPRRTAALLWWALGLLAALLMMAVAVRLSPSAPFTQGVDDWWRGINGATPDSGTYTWVLPMFFQFIGELGQLVIAFGIPIALLIVGRWRSALFFFVATFGAIAVVTQILKRLVDRPRPAADEALGLYGPLFSVDHGSFPSGHAVAVGSLVIGVAALIPAVRRTARAAWWIIGGLLMVGIVWQRTLINAHWLSDTIFGLVCGTGFALLMWWAFEPLIRKDDGRPVWFLHRGKTKAALTAA
ncbi:phosphatase PAP2 family protein [Microbacterium fluvii]|uniref:Phosphatase PAP2 family protein n=1 Tax=Microbacterium fluvii TaxID=415215 RepID=A0ABW2H8E2_9MICO|nr:phosphatase PAP2 family protein [Microbacterium fluvii]MCU4670990.1 phosphatase PAP2 family protein [Microbacterium fluvii]